MKEKQRLHLYLLIGCLCLLVFSWANYQRYAQKLDAVERIQASYQNCLQFRREFSQLAPVSEGEFQRISETDLKAEMLLMCEKAGISRRFVASVEFASQPPSTESEFSKNAVSIRFSEELTLSQFLSVLVQSWAVVREETGSGSFGQFQIQSFSLKDVDKQPVEKGEMERWACQDLTLSFLIKNDKSSR